MLNGGLIESQSSVTTDRRRLATKRGSTQKTDTIWRCLVLAPVIRTGSMREINARKLVSWDKALGRSTYLTSTLCVGTGKSYIQSVR